MGCSNEFLLLLEVEEGRIKVRYKGGAVHLPTDYLKEWMSHKARFYSDLVRLSYLNK